MSTEASPEQPPKKFFDPKANLKALVRLVVIVAILVGGIWLVIRLTAGKQTADAVTTKVLRQKVDLVDTIESLPATSLKAIGLSLPYEGNLSIEITVKKGNDIDVYVVRPDELDKIKAKQRFAYLQGLEAEKIKNYRRSKRVPSGSYQLVLVDKTLGLLSQKSSDIQIKAKLEP